mgnify:CR=1 FL=1
MIVPDVLVHGDRRVCPAEATIVNQHTFACAIIAAVRSREHVAGGAVTPNAAENRELRAASAQCRVAVVDCKRQARNQLRWGTFRHFPLRMSRTSPNNNA